MSDGNSIALVDNTRTFPPDGAEGLSPVTSTRRSITHKLTRSSVREGLARRKYAKYQRGRYDDTLHEDTSRESSLSRPHSLQPERTASRASSTVAAEPADGVTADGEVPADAASIPEEKQYEVDVLYENQRGTFCFGVPYYSERSLLNLDPAPWLTRNLEASPVDITNAQVPDPSWEWAWKTWYIDMSYDVDEEGWQYSFSFASKFAWHGTHPWGHSFARRRRWLRKRVKKSPGISRRDPYDRSQAYDTLDDFLTVRTTPYTGESSIGGETSRRSYLSTTREEQELGIPPDEITNVVVLMRALKMAVVDREKIEVVREFIHRGDEELVYLEEKMPDILSMLLFHTSRAHLLELLLRSIVQIPKSTADEAEKRKRRNLVNAVQAVDRRSKGFEFWNQVNKDLLKDYTNVMEE